MEKYNKLIKSKKYQGIYYKDIPNDRKYYIAYKNSNGNYSKYKVGLKSSGINEFRFYTIITVNKRSLIPKSISLPILWKTSRIFHLIENWIIHH